MIPTCAARSAVSPRRWWTPNAFAQPGGKLGVLAGMLPVARTPDQLAAVIAHEIAHVLADHSNERLTQELAVQGGLMLVDLFAEEPASLRHEVLRHALGIGAAYGLLLPYSRNQEREADHIGRDLMARAGFDPRASVMLWRNMAAVGGDQPPAFPLQPSIPRIRPSRSIGEPVPPGVRPRARRLEACGQHASTRMPPMPPSPNIS